MTTTAQHALWRAVLNGLPSFLASWGRHTRQAVTYPQWRDCQYLLAVWQQQADWPEDVAGYALRLRPLLCKSPEQQQQFMGYWLDHYAPSKTALATAADTAKPDATRVQSVGDGTGHSGQNRRQWLVVLGILLLLSLLAGASYYIYGTSEPVPLPPPVSVSRPSPSQNPNPNQPTISTHPQSPPTYNKPYLQTAPLRYLPPYFRPDTPLQNGLYWLLAIAAALLAIPLMWLWSRRRVAFRQNRSHNTDEQSLTLKAPMEAVAELQGGGFTRLLSRLRFAKWGEKRVNWAKTAIATTQSGGYPVLRYSDRQRQADFILIADRRHCNDQSAWLFTQLQATLKQAQIRVHCYDFDRHPEWLWQQGQATVKAEALQQVLYQHPGSRVLLVVEHAVLFYRFTGELQPWLSLLEGLPDYQLLLLTSPDARQLVRLKEANYRYRLVDGLTDNRELVDFSFPPAAEAQTLTGFRSDWLSNLKPPDIQPLYAWLTVTYGKNTLRLLALLALYPRLHGDLSHALFRYFASTKVSEPLNTNTLLKTLTLPWCRQGWLPKWLRDSLVLTLSVADHRHAQQFFIGLMARKSSEGVTNVSLPLQKPSGLAGWMWLGYALRLAKPDSPLRDSIFAKILLLPRWPWLELVLPRRLLNALPNVLLSQWATRLLLLAAMFGYFGAVVAWWQYDGQSRYGQYLFQKHYADNAQTQVTIVYHPSAAALVEPLAKGINSLGYQVAKQEDNTIRSNRVDAPAQFATELADTAQYMAWGADFAVEVGAISKISLAAMPQTGQVFRDTRPEGRVNGAYAEPLLWGLPVPVVNPAPVTVDLSIKPILPKMIAIPAGQFLMGSPKTDKDSDNDEHPQHKVTVPAFSLAETELTFAEWDKCVAAKACRQIDDNGWGREQRPVINVSWDDAQTYIAWLNKTQGLESGKVYRLPTEAEWEYAARAGSQTPYFSGNGLQCDYANGADQQLEKTGSYLKNWQYAKCSDGYMNTAPVKNFKSNRWRLL